MKITIDTKEDSKEEIKRAIQLLSNLVGTSSVGVIKKDDIFSSSSEEVNSDKVNSGDAFASMFGGGGSEAGESDKEDESAAGFDLGILSEPKKVEEQEEPEEDEDIPGVISY
ncbi:hypothetical protein GOV03_03115 [Candidatus Woesearchaeota archaeon]|nr:hypothetical protein [Candidatus Woesearchaeota archaeon]